MITLAQALKYLANIRSEHGCIDISYGSRSLVFDLHGGLPGQNQIYAARRDGTPGWVDPDQFDFYGYLWYDGATLKLTILPGRVYTQQGSNVTTSYSAAVPGVDTWYYVQFTLTDDGVFTLTTTIQTATSAPTYYAYATGTATYKIIIGHYTHATQTWQQRLAGTIAWPNAIGTDGLLPAGTTDGATLRWESTATTVNKWQETTAWKITDALEGKLNESGLTAGQTPGLFIGGYHATDASQRTISIYSSKDFLNSFQIYMDAIKIIDMVFSGGAGNYIGIGQESGSQITGNVNLGYRAAYNSTGMICFCLPLLVQYGIIGLASKHSGSVKTGTEFNASYCRN
jgi:hypothetical protein